MNQELGNAYIWVGFALSSFSSFPNAALINLPIMFNNLNDTWENNSLVRLVYPLFLFYFFNSFEGVFK